MNNGQADMTEIMSRFITLIGKKLPDDVTEKLEELAQEEKQPLAREIYSLMARNQQMAVQLNRPSCQDTGALQFWVRCGAGFPLLGNIETVLRKAVADATREAPLRHNVVETFDEYNTKENIGTGIPSIFWEIIPDNDDAEIDVYMAGGGCTLPGRAKVLMPSEGYEGAVDFILDVVTSYGLNACPPLLVGVGIANAVETAALLSKKALFRGNGKRNMNSKAAALERELIKSIDKIGLGPQGLGGTKSVMDVHIENTARHPSAIAVAVNVGCWSHRYGHIIFDKELNFEITTHREAAL